MANKVVVRVNNVHKTFKLPHEKVTSVKSMFVSMFHGKRTYEKQHVLNGVSFEVEKGDFFGIVGRNGSGKSTLLKLLAGIYSPNSGSIESSGKLIPFIELGVGFNHELTGRENVFLNGALLGFSREEMAEMYDEIVEFAELEKFMDQKLKNYSSGMQVRLAFSIAIRAKGDILVLDEVLAVGDEAFQRKCNDYFNKIKEDKNQTVILVTHSMEAVKKYCNKAILIKDGKIIAHGNPLDVANEYTLENVADLHADKKTDKRTGLTANKGVKNIKVELLSDKVVDQKGEIKFSIDYDVTEEINTVPAFSITDIDRNVWLQNDNLWSNVIQGKGHHKVIYTCKLPNYLSDCIVDIRVRVCNDN